MEAEFDEDDFFRALVRREPANPDDVLPPEEFERLVSAALAEEDTLREIAELHRWFVRRYPTARDRLRYVRRKYAEWTRKGR